MTKATYHFTIKNLTTDEVVNQFDVDSSNKMWKAAKDAFGEERDFEIRVLVEKDGVLFKNFTKKTVTGNRNWWMHNEVLETNRRTAKKAAEANGETTEAKPVAKKAAGKKKANIITGGKTRKAEKKVIQMTAEEQQELAEAVNAEV